MWPHIEAAAEYGKSCGSKACPARGCLLSSLSQAFCHKTSPSHAPQSSTLLYLIIFLSPKRFVANSVFIDIVLAQMSWKKQLSRGWWSSMTGHGGAVSVTLSQSTRQPLPTMLKQSTSSLMAMPVIIAISSVQQKMLWSVTYTSVTARRTNSHFEMANSKLCTL